MLKLILATMFLVLSFSAANADNDKHLAICFFEGGKIVLDDVSRMNNYDNGVAQIEIRKRSGGGVVRFSGAYSCIEVKKDDQLVDTIKKNFGSFGESK